jgi:hypothetical protein
MKFMNIDQLKQYASDNPVEWLVDDILKEASFNICAGGPKSGKSSLMRQLAVAVSKGQPFLGEATKRGEVLYICPDEQDTTELYESFTRLGAEGGLYVSAFPVNRYSLIADLKDALAEHSEVSLIVLDTLEKTVEMEDLNDYVKTLRDLGPLVDFATENKVTIVGTHHTNKRQSTSVAGAMMGSNGLGSVATTSLEVLVDHTGKRFLRSMQRYGREIERTELHFDPFRRIATLGESESRKSEQKAMFRVKDLRKRLIEYITANPGAEHQQIVENIPGNAQQIHRELRAMQGDGAVRTDGTGRRGNPYVYFPGEVPTESSNATTLREAA